MPGLAGAGRDCGRGVNPFECVERSLPSPVSGFASARRFCGLPVADRGVLSRAAAGSSDAAGAASRWTQELVSACAATGGRARATANVNVRDLRDANATCPMSLAKSPVVRLAVDRLDVALPMMSLGPRGAAAAFEFVMLVSTSSGPVQAIRAHAASRYRSSPVLLGHSMGQGPISLKRSARRPPVPYRPPGRRRGFRPPTLHREW